MYEVFNYVTGETVGYLETSEEADATVTAAWRQGLTWDWLPETEAETCEHGLSAWLCEGPNHYPTDL